MLQAIPAATSRKRPHIKSMQLSKIHHGCRNVSPQSGNMRTKAEGVASPPALAMIAAFPGSFLNGNPP